MVDELAVQSAWTSGSAPLKAIARPKCVEIRMTVMGQKSWQVECRSRATTGQKNWAGIIKLRNEVDVHHRQEDAMELCMLVDAEHSRSWA